MIRKKLFNIAIYNTKVMIVDCDNITELKELFKGTGFDFDREFTSNESIYAHTIKGYVEHKECTHHCIYLIFNTNHEKCTLRTKTIAHECIHVMHFLYDLKGHKFGNVELQEQDAYLMGYLYQKMSKFFNLETIVKTVNSGK